MEFKETSRRPAGQGSIVHGVCRASKDSQQQARSILRTKKKKKRLKTKTLKGNRKTTASCLVIIVIVGYCITCRESQKASSVGPDSADQNSQVTAASTNRVSESKKWDQTMSGINPAPSDMWSNT